MFPRTSIILLAFNNGDSLVNLILPVVGIGIVLLCLILSFTRVSESLRVPQRFSGAGVTMEISILTVFVLLGFILSLSSFFLQYRGYLGQQQTFEEKEQEYKDQISQLNASIRIIQKQAELSRTFDMTVLLKPKFDLAKGMPRLKSDDMVCSYLAADADPEDSDVTKAGKDAFRVTLKNIKSETLLRYVSLKNKVNGREWRIENFRPFEAIFELEEVTEENETAEEVGANG